LRTAGPGLARIQSRPLHNPESQVKKEGSQVVSATTQLKFLAPDGKRRLADMLDYNEIIDLGKVSPRQTPFPPLRAEATPGGGEWGSSGAHAGKSFKK